MVAAIFLAAFALLFAAAFAFVLALVLFSAGSILLAGAVAHAGFLVAGAVLGAGAVFAVGSEADAVGAGHLAVVHALLLFSLGTGGVASDRVIVLSGAIAGNHCECESDSEESRN